MTYEGNPVHVSQTRARAEIAAGRFQIAESILNDLIDRNQDLAGSLSILSTGKKDAGCRLGTDRTS